MAPENRAGLFDYHLLTSFQSLAQGQEFFQPGDDALLLFSLPRTQLPTLEKLAARAFGYLLTKIVAIGPAIAASIAIIAMIIIATLNRLLRFSSSLASLFASTWASYISLSFV